MSVMVPPAQIHRASVPAFPEAARAARQVRKEATRNRVIEAARELFDSQGYEGTTIREIAVKAGVSVGSVFTTFSSKGEVLSQVMQERLTPLYAELDRVLPRLRGSTCDRLRSMFAIHFAFEAPHIRLFLAHLAAAYDWTLSRDAKPYGRNLRLKQAIRDCLERGVAEGDVSTAIDLSEIIDLLMAAYAWSYRHAARGPVDADALTAIMDRQIGLIAEGFNPR